MRYKLLFIALFFCSSVFAQKGHYITIKANSSASSLKYKIDGTSSNSSFGWGTQLQYTYLFNDHWGINSGLGFSRTSSSVLLESIDMTSGKLIDSDGDEYISYIYLRDWEEEQEINFLDIPILATFQYSMGANNRWTLFADAGLKIKLPLSSSYNVVEGSYENRGYYPGKDLWLYDLPGRYEETVDYKPSGDVSMKTSYSAVLNLGAMYKIDDQWQIQAGLVLDHGLNDLQDGASALIQNDASNNKTYSGGVNSTLTGKSLLSNVGIEIGLRYRFGKKKISKKEIVTETIVAQPTVIPKPVPAVEAEEKIVVPEPVEVIETAPIESVKEQVIEPIEETVELPVETKEEQEAVAEADQEIDQRVLEIMQSTSAEDQLQKDEDKQVDQSVSNIMSEQEIKVLQFSVTSYPLSATKLNADQTAIFKEKIRILKKYKNIRITITGHTDNSRSEAGNLIVGQKRADNTKAYFIKNGIPADRIITTSKGESSPKYKNDSEAHRSANRRVELDILPIE